MAQQYRVPPSITNEFSARAAGLWTQHRTASGAWVRAWPHRHDRHTLVLARTEDGWEPVPCPQKRPGHVSGESGQHTTRRVQVPVGDGWAEAATEAGVPLSVWIAGAAAQRFRRQNPAR